MFGLILIDCVPEGFLYHLADAKTFIIGNSPYLVRQAGITYNSETTIDRLCRRDVAIVRNPWC